MSLSLAQAGLLFLLALLIPALLHLPLARIVAPLRRRFGRDAVDDQLSNAILLVAFVGLLVVLQHVFHARGIPELCFVLASAAVLGGLESAYRLPTQYTIPIGLYLVTQAYFLGLGFHPSRSWGAGVPMGGLLVDYPVTLLFYTGVSLSVGVLDRLRGLASGVLLIMSFSLLVLLLHWTWGSSLLVMLVIAGVCGGHLLLSTGKRHLRLGRGGQLQIAMLLAATTISSRTWGFTLGMLFIALVAIAVPMVDTIYTAFHRLSSGAARDGKSHVKSLLLNIGFTERFVVYTMWFITLLFGVLLNTVYEAESPALAIATGLSLLVTAVFVVGALGRIGERIEKRRDPAKLRILFLSHYFHPEVNAPASRLYEHGQHWINAGHDVTVICPVPSAPHGWPYKGYANSWWNEEMVAGIRVIRVWTFIAANKGKVRRTLNYLSYMGSTLFALLLVRRHDVLVATSPQFFCGLAGAVASLFRKERFVLEIRDLWPESIEAVGATSATLPIRVIERLARWMYQQAHHIVTVGEGYRQRLIEIGAAPPERITVIPNGVDFTVFQPPQGAPVLARFGLANRFVVSYVGTVGMAHGLDVVLSAAEQLRGESHIAFAIVGDGAERARLEREADTRGLSNVIFAGLLPKDDIPSVLSESAACLVHLRKRDLFKTVLPSKLFEAMGMRRPVLLGVEGYSKELLERAAAGIAFEPENGSALAAAVLRLAQDHQLGQTMGERGHRFVLQSYTRDALATAYAELLKTVSLLPQEKPDLARENTPIGEKSAEKRPTHP